MQPSDFIGIWLMASSFCSLAAWFWVARRSRRIALCMANVVFGFLVYEMVQQPWYVRVDLLILLPMPIMVVLLGVASLGIRAWEKRAAEAVRRRGGADGGISADPDRRSASSPPPPPG